MLNFTPTASEPLAKIIITILQSQILGLTGKNHLIQNLCSYNLLFYQSQLRTRDATLLKFTGSVGGREETKPEVLLLKVFSVVFVVFQSIALPRL